MFKILKASQATIQRYWQSMRQLPITGKVLTTAKVATDVAGAAIVANEVADLVVDALRLPTGDSMSEEKQTAVAERPSESAAATTTNLPASVPSNGAGMSSGIGSFIGEGFQSQMKLGAAAVNAYVDGLLSKWPMAQELVRASGVDIGSLALNVLRRNRVKAATHNPEALDTPVTESEVRVAVDAVIDQVRGLSNIKIAAQREGEEYAITGTSYALDDSRLSDDTLISMLHIAMSQHERGLHGVVTDYYVNKLPEQTFLRGIALLTRNTRNANIVNAFWNEVNDRAAKVVTTIA